jgi:hypothetical protein
VLSFAWLLHFFLKLKPHILSFQLTPHFSSSTLAKLKRQSNEIFDLWFFHKSIATRPLSNTLKYFRIRGDIREYVLCYIVRSRDSPLCNIALSRLHAMQHSAEFLLKIFSIEIRLYCKGRSSSAILGEKNSALCNIERSHDSALCNLARSYDSALCCIAQSLNCIARSQLTELWLCATAFKTTIEQNCIHR